MVNVAEDGGSAATERRSRWLFAMAATSLVTIAGLGAAVQQFVVKYLWDQSAHTRTVGGVLYMLLGLLGLFVPVLLLRYKPRFLSLRPSRQWLLAVAIPLLYLLAFAVCIEASRRSTTLVLPRPFTPTAVVIYNATDLHVEFRGGWKKHLPAGHNSADLQRGQEQFSAHLFQGFLRHPRRETITIDGRVKELPDGTIEVLLDVDAGEPVRFSVENLDNVDLRRDGQPIGEAESQSGKFRLTITGRPQSDT